MRLFPCACLLASAALLCAQIVPPAVLVKVEPEYDPDLKTYLLDPARIDLTIAGNGEPFALESTTRLPANVVAALEKWRFTPGTKDGRPNVFTVRINLQVRRPIGEYLEHTDRPTVIEEHPVDLSPSAIEGMTPERATSIEKKLKDNDGSVASRSHLLLYCASRTDKDAFDMRVRQIAWLVRNKPDARVLGLCGSIRLPRIRTTL